MNIVRRRKLFLVGAKKLTAYTLEAIAGCRVADFFGNCDAEPGMRVFTRRINEDEVPSDDAFSDLTQIYEFRAL